MAPLSAQPDEILLEIGRYLDGHSLKSLCLTASQFRPAAQECLFRDIQITGPDTARLLFQSLIHNRGYRGFVKTATIRGDYFEGAGPLLLLPAVQHVRVDFGDGRFMNLPKLVEKSTIPSLELSLPLEFFRSNGDEFPKGWVADILANFSALKEIKVDCHSWDPVEFVAPRPPPGPPGLIFIPPFNPGPPPLPAPLAPNLQVLFNQGPPPPPAPPTNENGSYQEFINHLEPVHKTIEVLDLTIKEGDDSKPTFREFMKKLGPIESLTKLKALKVLSLPMEALPDEMGITSLLPHSLEELNLHEVCIGDLACLEVFLLTCTHNNGNHFSSFKRLNIYVKSWCINIYKDWYADICSALAKRVGVQVSIWKRGKDQTFYWNKGWEVGPGPGGVPRPSTNPPPVLLSLDQASALTMRGSMTIDDLMENSDEEMDVDES